MKTQRIGTVCAAIVVSLWLPRLSAASEPQASERLEQAKDCIVDERWRPAIGLLRAAASDPRERNKDEALFWLAHSLHQSGELAGAVETISHLERSFPKSRWVKPARSLRVELAQKLRRSDVLWWTATATLPTDGQVASPPAALRTPRAPASPQPAPMPPPAGGQRGYRPGKTPPLPPAAWMSEYSLPDMDLRIQALGSLMQTDAARVIPMLRDIALETGNSAEASRALFVLAQSGRPDAHSSVLEVAKRAPEPVSVAAVRELGRFGGPKVPEELMMVYDTGKPRVKYQVVNALGERAATTALMQIAQSEPDIHLRDAAIVTLGQAGGHTQLRRMYVRARPDAKRPIIVGLFNARAEAELIQIAEREHDLAIRREVLARLRLLGTPKAKQYLEKTQPDR